MTKIYIPNEPYTGIGPVDLLYIEDGTAHCFSHRTGKARQIPEVLFHRYFHRTNGKQRPPAPGGNRDTDAYLPEAA